jgi:hypothetical protein
MCSYPMVPPRVTSAADAARECATGPGSAGSGCVRRHTYLAPSRADKPPALPFGHAAPHAVHLAEGERILQARITNRTSGTEGACGLDRCGIASEEKLGICAAARSARAPRLVSYVRQGGQAH